MIEKLGLPNYLCVKDLKNKWDTASAGDIVSEGFTKQLLPIQFVLKISTPLEALPITPPTMSMTVSVNDSPLVGRDGDKLTGNMIAERLYKEAETNIAIKITQSPQKDALKSQKRRITISVYWENAP